MCEKKLRVMISAVRKTNNDVLFRALCVNVVNKILKKAASNQKCSRNLGVASAFLCMRFPVLYGFFTAQLIRECPFFGPICIHTLSNVGPCACGNKRIHGFVDSTRTWQSCHKHDLVACHGLPRGHGPSPLDSFTSGSKNCVHQSKITPGDHEIVETSLTMFYAGLLTGVNRMGSQPQLYQLYFEKRYGLALSDGSISNRVSIEIAKLERSLGANVVEILGNLNGRAISCDAYVHDNSLFFTRFERIYWTLLSTFTSHFETQVRPSHVGFETRCHSRQFSNRQRHWFRASVR